MEQIKSILGILTAGMPSAQATKIFKKGSTTYFTASLFFPASIKQDVFTLYAFVRTADDFVDQVPSDTRGFYGFVQEYRRALLDEEVGSTVITEFVRLQRKYAFPQNWVDAFLKAMEADLYKATYQTLDELLLYMYGSAEVIGLMMGKIMGVSPSGYQSARMLGRAMQYANFLRDIAEDIQLGRQYIPKEIVAAYGMERLDVATIEANSEHFTRLYTAEVARYQDWNAKAQVGFKYLPRSVRVPIAAASEMYSWTLSTAVQNPLLVLKQKIKPSKWQVVGAVIKQSMAHAWS